ncbi:MAG: hypothetical protein J7M25_07265 [Deltaproteobacteria bacterium]|nr:hypothetical protein [Deltaproteobacteria bacterium]
MSSRQHRHETNKTPPRREHRSSDASWTRLLAVAVASAALATFALMMTGLGPKAVARVHRDPMIGFYPVSMPRYPGVKEYPLTHAMKSGAAKLYMSYFVTRDEPLVVEHFYENRWRAAGYHVTSDITLRGGHVSALDIRSNVVRQVLITKRGNDAMVQVSVTINPSVLTKPVKPEVPVFPGAEGVTSVGAKDPGTGSTIVTFVDFAKMDENLSFYKSKMGSSGWTLKENASKVPQMPKNYHTLIFRRANAECTINFMPVPGSKQIRVHITQVTTP